MICLPATTLLLAALLMGFDTLGQQRPGQPLDTDISRRPDGTPELVRFSNPVTAPAATDAARVLRTTLGLGAQTELRASRPAETDELGLTHQRYQQFYQGLPVEFSAYNTLARNGKLELLNGELQPLADGAVNIHPRLTAAQALAAALRFVHADKYMWQMPNEGKFAKETEGKATFRPTGQLVIVADNRAETADTPGKLVLAWKFDIYAAQPDSRAWIYVDAQTGAVVNRDAISQEAAATATFRTRYSGTRQLANESYGAYYLWEYTRGLGIETNNAQRTNSTAGGPNLYDANNVWTAAEYDNANQDWVGGDAHFGAQQTYDYWLNVHNRNSFDGAGAKLKSYYHYDDTPGDGKGWSNARWNGAVMLYGDGSGGPNGTSPLTTLDICGHEMGHAICKYTAGLKYFRESGALNESFSDIWGACIENRAINLYGLTGKNTWLIAEEIYSNGGFLRSLSDPKAGGQPDTYQGAKWVYQSAATDTVDFGGVHTNSGVLNKWFYLVSQGGNGTNDKGNGYNVTGIGMTKAAKIAYLTEKLLSPTSTYNSARLMAIQAATTLYGINSLEMRTVANAMYAVGLGSSISYGNASTSFIDLVSISSLYRASVADGGYYNGVLAGVTAPTVTRCAQQTLVHSAGFTGAATTQYWNVWVDFNQDGDFGDAGEQVVFNKMVSNNTGWVVTPFVVPATAALGLARMRVAMGSSYLFYPCGSVGNGEAEDYNLNIAAAAPVGLPVSLSATNITATTATVQWGNVTGAASYTVRYRMVGNATWTVATTATNSKALINLFPGKQYQFTVQALNGCGTTGLTSQSAFFSTPAQRPTGTDPDQPAAVRGTVTATAYPNPATDVLRLTLTDATGTETSPATVEVFDLRGARVLTAAYDGSSGTLQVGTLTPGLYTATLRPATGTPVHVRFVKE